MPVDGSKVGFQQKVLFVWAKGIVLNGKRLIFTGLQLLGRDQDAFGRPGSVVELFDLGTALAPRQSGVVNPVRHGPQSVDGFAAKGINAPDVVQGNCTRFGSGTLGTNRRNGQGQSSGE